MQFFGICAASSGRGEHIVSLEVGSRGSRTMQSGMNRTNSELEWLDFDADDDPDWNTEYLAGIDF